MAEDLVVGFPPRAREAVARPSLDPARRARALRLLALLWSALVLVPWVAVTAVEGFEPRSLVLLAFLLPPAALVVHAGRLERRPRPQLGPVAFVVGPDQIRLEPYVTPTAAPALPAEVWPTSGTVAEVRRSVLLGARLVLRVPDGRRRVYPASVIDTAPGVVAARLSGR